MSEVATQTNVGEITFGPPTAFVQWKIRDYFSLPQQDNRHFESPNFDYLGTMWYLQLSRTCVLGNCVGWISLYLVMRRIHSAQHRMQFRIGIIARDGSKVCDSKYECTYFRNGFIYGSHKCLSVSVINEKKNDIAPDSVLTVFCTMTDSKYGSVHADVQTEMPPGAEKLAHDLTDLLFSGEATDVTLKVKDREYKVHSAILVARSTVFSAMMKHDWKEKNSGVVQIDDCNPDTFQHFLTYLYSGNLEKLSVDSAFALHNIADKYDVQELKSSCVQFLMNKLSVEIFCDVLSLSLRYNESEALEKAVAFFAENKRSIFVTTKWLAFIKEHPLEANELLIKAEDCNSLF